MPEAYRLKFRNLRKDDKMTYLEFARAKEQCFNEWCSSMDVENINQLRELILMEDFKSNVPSEIKLYIEERQGNKIARAAELADEHSLTHHFHTKPQWKDWKKTSAFQKNDRSKEVKTQETRFGDKGNKSVKETKCYFCDKKGHKIVDCFKRKAYLETQKKPVGAVYNAASSAVPNEESQWLETIEHFGDHLMSGKLSLHEQGVNKPITILRDTGTAVSLLLRSSLPKGCCLESNEVILVGGFPNSCTPCPILSLYLETEPVKGTVKLAVTDQLPVKGIELLLGNDLVRGKGSSNPVLRKVPIPDVEVAITTRSGLITDNEGDLNLNLEDSTNNVPIVKAMSDESCLERDNLIRAQSEDETLAKLLDQCLDSVDIDDLSKEQYVIKDQVLHRLSRPVTASSNELLDQIVVPNCLREKVMRIAHENLMSGHLGIKKTYQKVWNYFYWTGMRKDIKKYVNSCYECQMAGKPNKPIPKAPLINIPMVGDPFEDIVIDIVGPLPRSKRGNNFILSIMDRMSRYPEGIPIRNSKASTIVHHLVLYFTRFGLPKRIQTDRGTNFTGKYFEDRMRELGIQHVTSTPYHPESQGIVERFHQTLKSILRKMCDTEDNLWDDKLPYALFAIRSAPSETLGISPFELIFGHRVRGPLEVIRETWEDDRKSGNIMETLAEMRANLYKAWEVAKTNEVKAQGISKKKFDKKAKSRHFAIGDFVLILLPKEGSSLQYKFSGPFKILDKRGDVNYLIEGRGKSKARWVHVNLLKKYNVRPSPSMVIGPALEDKSDKTCQPAPKNNSRFLCDFEEEVPHLICDQVREICSLLHSYPDIIKDTPGLTDLIEHDVELTNETPIRQHPY